MKDYLMCNNWNVTENRIGEVAQLKLHFNLLHASHISEQQVIFDLISILRVIRGDRFLWIHVPLLQVFESLLIELSSKSVVYF